MSYYEDERQRARPTREKARRDDYYDDESAYSYRGYDNRAYTDNRTTALVRRRDSYDDVDEEVTRDFSPPGGNRGGGGYYRETTIRRSGVRPTRARSYDDDRSFDDRYEGAYSDRYRDDRRDRDRHRRYSSDSRSRSRTPPPAKRDRRKSKVEDALASLGLGGLVGGILGKDSRDRSSSRDRHRSRSRGGRDRAYSETRSDRKRSRSRGPTREQVTQAIKAALLAGAGEAFRVRKEPGGFSGEKGKRILTAAVTAGGVDGLINHKKNPEEHRTRDTIGSAVAGVATSRIVNGPRSKSRGRKDSRSPDSRRGRSQSRGSVSNLLAGGAVAAAAKKVYDNVRSKSRGRSESPSGRSDASRSPPREKSRRRSVSRAAARGLAAIGLNNAAEKMDPDRERDRSRSRSRSRSVSRRRRSDDYDDRNSYYSDYREDVGQPRSNVNGRARSASQSGTDWQVGQPRGGGPRDYSLDFGPRHTGDPDTDSDSDLGSSSGEEKERKQGKRKLLITSGLAGVATIHAGHGLYQSYEQRHARKLAVREGRISAETAKKSKNRDRLQDAASIGIAALGVKGAYSEWKEMMEHKEHLNKEEEKLKRHHSKRQARRLKYDRLAKQGYLEHGYANSMPNLQNLPPMKPPPGGWHHSFEGPAYQDHQGPYSAGGYQQGPPQYYDANPYGGSFAHPGDHGGSSTLPPPPVGDIHSAQGRSPRERSPSRGRPER